MRKGVFGFLGGALLLLAASTIASAHHAFAAEFDWKKPVSITGTVTKVDEATRTVILTDGTSLLYDELVLATGSRILPEAIENFDTEAQHFYSAPAALKLVSATVGLPEPEVFGIATFYTMFNLAPVGRHHLQVCMTLSCSLMGADRLFRHLERKLGVGHGGTTPDGRFTLRRVECLAACGGAPCMQVNFDYHENLDEAKVDRLLEKLT